MKTLIVYDNKGKIFNQVSGEYDIPDGLNYIESTIPDGKILVSVDVESKQPILQDQPKTELDKIKQAMEETQEVLNMLLMGGI